MIFRPSKIINSIITAIIIILAFPVTAILASWNSLPGSTLYPVKRNLEKAALTLLPDSVLEMQLRFKLLDRRSNEANLAIIQHPSNNKPLEEIVAEAKNAQIITMKLQSETQQQTSTQLIEKLNQTSSKLDNLKQTVSQNQPQTQISTTPSQTSPTTHSQTSPTTPIPPDTQDDIIDAIDQTQDDLDDIIDDLQDNLNQPSLDHQPPNNTSGNGDDTPPIAPATVVEESDDTPPIAPAAVVEESDDTPPIAPAAVEEADTDNASTEETDTDDNNNNDSDEDNNSKDKDKKDKKGND